VPAERTVLEALANRGWHESINYAFTDPALQSRLFPDAAALALGNAIASDLSVMRVSLWPGLVRVALENQRRQADRIRLFERGAKFVVRGEAGSEHAGEVTEVDSLAGIALGRRSPEQWGLDAKAAVDFYDVKADVEALLAASGAPEAFRFEAGSLPMLHPGRTARVLRDGQAVGWLGELHPRLVRELDFAQAPILFELDFLALQVQAPRGREISRFPHVRRDLAVVLPEAVSYHALRERVTMAGSSLLCSMRVFDVYRGAGVETGCKSIALGLIFQDVSRTLTDEDVEQAMTAIVTDLRVHLDATVRQ
jgi:phenylalanyl-tRNA synthetase beta chain